MKTIRLFSTLFCLLLVWAAQGSKIVVSGAIASNTTWLADTVQVSGNLTINSGVRLTINPGTRVEVFDDVYIEIKGQIRANGNLNDTIYFYSSPGDLWGGFRIINPSTFTDSTLFRYCSFIGARGELSNGGAFYMDNAKQVIFRQCLFRNNESLTGDGGAMYLFDSNPLIEYCLFTENESGGQGAGLYIESSQNLNLNSEPYIHDCVFRNNDAGSHGGAIYGYRGSTAYTIENCVFRDNVGNKGGALAFVDTDPIIKNNIISNNTSMSYEGGAILLDESDALIQGNQLDSNFAYSSSFQSRGGAIAVRLSDVDILENSFRGNESGYGGAIYIGYVSTANIKRNILDSNIANQRGAAVIGSGPPGGTVTLYIDSNQVINNRGSDNTYALYANSITTEMNVTNNLIEHNQVGGVGYGPSYNPIPSTEVKNNIIRYNGWYGITASHSDVVDNVILYNAESGINVLERVNIKDNLIGYNAGCGIRSTQGNMVSIEGNDIFWNTDTSEAGGIYLSNSDAVLINNRIRNNQGIDGGGIGIHNSSPRIVGNLICNNSTTKGGGVFIDDDPSQPEFIQNTIVNNLAQTKGGGVYHHGQSLMDFINTILWGNEVGGSSNQLYVHYDNQDPDFYHCSIEGGSSAFDLNFGFYSGAYQNNLTVNPNFSAPSSGAGHTIDSLGLADWSLQKGSLLVDAGDPDTTGLSLPPTDLSGAMRIQNDTVDIGAYESPAPLRLTTFPTNYAVCEGDPVSFTVATNLSPARFTWYKNGILLQDSTLGSFSIQQTIPADSGYYSLMATTATDTVLDSLSLTVHPLPVLPSLGPDTGFCAGHSLSLQAPTGFNSYLWSDGLQGSSLSVSQPGTYWYQVTDLNACTGYSDTVVVQEYSNYSFSLGSDTVVCAKDSVSIGIAVPDARFLWSTGDTTAFIYPSQPGTYWVQLTDTNSCIKTDTIQVSQDTLGIGLPDTLVVTSNASFKLGIASDFSGILWNTGSNQDTINIDPQQGLLPYYSVSATNINGCSVADTVFIVNSIGLPEGDNLFSLQLYPNPSDGTFYISSDVLQGTPDIYVWDMTGRQVAVEVNYMGQVLQIRLRTGAGFYRVQIREGASQVSRMIVISP